MRRIIKKQAGIFSDVVGSEIYGTPLLPVPGPLKHAINTANTLGGIGGLLEADQPRLKKAIDRANDSPVASIIPGVGDYRTSQKMLYNALKNNKEKAVTNVIGEKFGRITGDLPLGVLGGIAGLAIGGANIDPNADPKEKLLRAGLYAGTGTALGYTVPKVVAALAALITRRRNAAEQKAHDQSSNISNWLLPGVAQYNKYKRIGRIRGEEIGEK